MFAMVARNGRIPQKEKTPHALRHNMPQTLNLLVEKDTIWSVI